MSYPPPGGQPPQQPPWQPPPGQPPYGAPPPGYPGPGQPPVPPRRRKAWLLPVILVAVLLLVAGAVVLAILLARGDGATVASLDEGDCLVSSDLAAANGSVGGLEVGDCDKAHDAEVYATFELGDDEADDYDDDAPAECAGLLADHDSSLDELAEDNLEVRPLTQDDEPAAGDDVVCLVRHAKGDELDQPIFD